MVLFLSGLFKFSFARKNCPSTVIYNDIGKILQEKALELKNSYIELIGRLGIKYSEKYPLAWWTSMVAERNEMSTHAFLTVCYYNIFSDIYENDSLQNRSLIIVESISLYHLIIKQLRKKHKVVKLGKPYYLTWTFFARRLSLSIEL